MSWFRRRVERKSPEYVNWLHSGMNPNTKLEVFQNHWKQAWTVMSCQQKRTVTMSGQATVDGVEAVLRNFEQMVTLLVSEEAIGRQSGPILHYILESELLEKFCAWCTINISAHERLRLQQLRLFELVVSQSKQVLLVHKSVIKPLLRLLLDVADSQDVMNGELEFELVHLLQQICICISQQNLTLTSFFSTESDHGPARFLIFCLLIPYIHREGPAGQKARDALLLIVTLSARHPHIGTYIANNSDFCPVLATGLSGLYSSLPRRIIPPSIDWYSITPEDCMRIPDLQMFLNSLQFSNAVVQVAHPLVRNQLIDFIYSGFLIPVMAPALHQISREQVMTATAYLDLFIRHVTDPHLLKAVLKFVLTEKYDGVVILDSLLSRISSNSLLSTVTLALFHTLVNLNCEDVMFQLVFRYLVPCTHVMVSQRRSVRDLDIYGKSAEKFLSLRPACCTQGLSRNTLEVLSSATSFHRLDTNTSVPTQRSSGSVISSVAGRLSSVMTLPLEAIAGARPGETNYFVYLHDARSRLEQTARASHHWSYFFDGESPPADSIAMAEKLVFTECPRIRTGVYQNSDLDKCQGGAAKIKYAELDNILTTSKMEEDNERNIDNRMISDLKSIDFNRNDSLFLQREKYSNELRGAYRRKLDSKLLASLDNLDVFLEYLNELDLPCDEESTQNSQPVDEYMAALDRFLASITARESQRVVTCNTGREGIHNASLNSNNVLAFISTATEAVQLPCLDRAGVTMHDLSNVDASRGCKVAVETIILLEAPIKSEFLMQKKHLDIKASNFVDIPRMLSKNMDTMDDPFIKSDGQCNARTINNKQTSDISSTTTIPATRNKDHIVPKGLPSSLKSSMNPVYKMSAPMNLPDGVLSPFKSVLPPVDIRVRTNSSLALKKQKYLDDPPNVGPFLSVLLARLEGMMGNSLHFNLLLTDVLSRLAAYPQPLLRSFLFSHNLVFQPSVKSFIQVLSSLRQKLDSLSLTVKHFDSLVVSARQNLAERESQHLQAFKHGMLGKQVNYEPDSRTPRAGTTGTTQYFKGRRKLTLSDLIFRRSPGKEKMHGDKKQKNTPPQDLQEVRGNIGSASTRNSIILSNSSNLHSLSTWNAVYCAVILDEFLKELAALSQEHSVLHLNQGV